MDIDDNYQKKKKKKPKVLLENWRQIIYFMFIVLLFSFSSAPFLFTKVMSCLVKILEKVRNKKFAYLLTTVLYPPLPFPHISLSTSETDFVKHSLTQCGFIINFEKSVTQPQKELIWLGIIYK